MKQANLKNLIKEFLFIRWLNYGEIVLLFFLHFQH